MRASRKLAALAALVVGVPLSACDDFGFDPPSIVMGPRVLAVVAEPPEAPPGVDIHLTPFTAQAEGATFEMRVDLSTAALAAAAGQSLGTPGEPSPLRIDGDHAVLDGALTQTAVDTLLELVEEAALGTPEAVVRQVYGEVGLVVPIQFVVHDATGEIIAEGFKRVILSSRAGLTTNPPAPRFAIDGREVFAEPGSRDCASPMGPPVVAAGSVVTFMPAAEDWLETYPVYDLDGQLLPGMENAYYSWFATAGELQFAVTRAPEQAVEWTAPVTRGPVGLWLVVRDGHLGTSVCRTSVTVE